MLSCSTGLINRLLMRLRFSIELHMDGWGCCPFNWWLGWDNSFGMLKFKFTNRGRAFLRQIVSALQTFLIGRKNYPALFRTTAFNNKKRVGRLSHILWLRMKPSLSSFFSGNRLFTEFPSWAIGPKSSRAGPSGDFQCFVLILNPHCNCLAGSRTRDPSMVCRQACWPLSHEILFTSKMIFEAAAIVCISKSGGFILFGVLILNFGS